MQTGEPGVPFATSARLPSTIPPVPLAADLNYATGAAWCKFDQLLTEVPLWARNWEFTDPASSGLRSRVLTASPLNDTVYFTTVTSGNLPPPYGLRYDAVPPDCTNVHGDPAAPFLGFPVNFHVGKATPRKRP